MCNYMKLCFKSLNCWKYNLILNTYVFIKAFFLFHVPTWVPQLKFAS